MFWKVSLFSLVLGLFTYTSEAHSCRCPKNFAPVCGANGRTYGNACGAKCDGVKIRHQGACKKRHACPHVYVRDCPPGFSRQWNITRGCRLPGKCKRTCPPRKVVPCPHGAKRTWVIKNGCRVPGKCSNHCACIALYAPVCGVNGKTYGNSCRARCAGIKIRHTGACKPRSK